MGTNEGKGRMSLDRRAMLAGTAAAAVLVAEARAQTANPAGDIRSRATILIKGATIVSMDAGVGDLPSADILIQNGVIRAISPGLTAPADALVIEAAGKIACPGFVNGHIHLPQVLQRGLSAASSSATPCRCGRRTARRRTMPA